MEFRVSAILFPGVVPVRHCATSGYTSFVRFDSMIRAGCSKKPKNLSPPPFHSLYSIRPREQDSSFGALE